MTPEENARQQIDATLSRGGWTSREKLQVNLCAAISGTTTMSMLGEINLQRATRLRQPILQKAFEGRL